MLEKAKEYREKLLEAAVELDDEAMAAYLDGKEPDEATLKRLIRKARADRRVLSRCCAARPSRTRACSRCSTRWSTICRRRSTCPPIKGIDEDGNEVVRKRPNDKEPLALLAFKIMDDPFVGTITFCRIYSGTLLSGTGVINSTRDRKERIGRMLLMHANNREDIKEAYAGDIVALAGLKEARTGDTLCDPDKPVILEKMEFPEPVIEIAIEPKSKADQEKLGVALAKLAAEDPVVPGVDRPGVRPDHPQGHGRTASRHQGRHPAAAPTRSTPISARRRWRSASASPSRPRSTTPTRSRPAVPASSPQVKIVVEPNEPGEGFEFESKVVGGSVPKEYIPGVEKGLDSVMDSGVVAGFPVVDVKVHADRRQVSRRRLLGAGLRNRIARGVPRSAAEGQVGPARADHEGRSGDAGRLHRRRSSAT